MQTCVNHPDVPALDRCRACGRPLCQLCVYFREGQVYCVDHVGGTKGDGPFAPPLVPPLGMDPAGDVLSATPPIGTIVAAYEPQTTDHGTQAWAADPRLEPLPMAMRPGWTDEPLQQRPNTTAETLGIVGLVLSLISLPFNICCGIGGVVAAPLALAGGGCSIAALVLAPKARNPGTARWTGGFGLVLALLSLAVLVCYLAFTASMMSGLIFSGFPTPYVYWTPTP